MLFSLEIPSSNNLTIPNYRKNNPSIFSELLQSFMTWKSSKNNDKWWENLSTTNENQTSWTAFFPRCIPNRV